MSTYVLVHGAWHGKGVGAGGGAHRGGRPQGVHANDQGSRTTSRTWFSRATAMAVWSSPVLLTGFRIGSDASFTGMLSSPGAG
jgi:hypothetical protein